MIGQVDAFASSKSQTLFASGNTSIISLRGKEGAGQQIVSESICQRLGINILIANIDSVLAKPSAELPFILSSVQQEAILQNAAIYWQNTHSLATSGRGLFLIFLRLI